MALELEVSQQPVDLDFDAHMAASLPKPADEPAKESPEPSNEAAAELKTAELVAKPEDKPDAKAAAEKEKVEFIEVVDPETGQKMKIDLKTGEGKRMFRLIRRTHEAEELARLAVSGKLPAAKEPVAVKEELAAPVAPKPEDFKTVDEYIDAKVKFGIDQALAADRAAQQSERQQRESDTRNAAIDARESAFIKEHPDYRDVLATGLFPALGPGIAAKHPTALAIQRVIQNHEQGPRLAYLLGKDPAEHARLAALPPELATLELGQLLHEHATPPKPAPKEEKRSNAPPPPEVVEGRSSAADPDPMNRDFDSHVAIGNREDAERSSKSRRRASA